MLSFPGQYLILCLPWLLSTWRKCLLMYLSCDTVSIFFLKHVHLKVGGKHRIWCNNKVKEVCVHPCRKDTSLHPGVDGRDIIVYSCSVTMTATHNPWLLSTWNVWLVSESWDVVWVYMQVSIYYEPSFWKTKYNIIFFHIDSPLKYYFGCIGLNKIH